MRTDRTDNLSAEQLSRLLAVGAAGGQAPPGDAAPRRRRGANDDPPDREPGPFDPGQIVDDLQIIEEIGRGGMCIVYKAAQPGLRRQVALKALRPSLARLGAVARRFRHESVLAASLSHPGIVPIFSHGRDSLGRPWFTMELVDGMSIGERVACDGPMSLAGVLRVAVQACDALGAAHASGIIHRDVTPQNIILQTPGRVRLVDFGIAQDTTGRLAGVTRTGREGGGTLAFMSPEQNLGRRLDRRTDIFSLGMTLYYALTGATAYRASNRAELALAFRMQRPRRPEQAGSPPAGPLGRIVMKMIAVDPADRYPSCDELAVELAACGVRRRRPVAARAEPGRGVVAAALLAMTALAAYAWGPLACTGDKPGPSQGASGSIIVAAPQALDSPAPPPAPAPASDPAQKRELTPSQDDARAPAPTPVPKQAPTPPLPARPPPAAAARGAEAAPLNLPAPQAVVQWVYQPDEGRGFSEAGTMKGQAVLTDDNPLSLGLFLFDPTRGLIAYSPANGATADFRIEIEGRRIGIRRDARPDGTGCIASVAGGDFDDAAPPRQGYQPLYRHTLSPNSVLFFRCAKGGHAKLRVTSIR